MFFSIGNGNHERRHRRWSRFAALVAVAFLATSLLGLAGCSSDSDKLSRLPVGVWAGPSEDFPDSYTITTSSITYQSDFSNRTATIVAINDAGINGGDAALGGNVLAEDTINPGFAVIRYSAPSEIEGQYNVFRWGDLPNNSNGRYMAEWNDGDPDYALGAFEGATEAMENATIENGSWFLGVYTLTE